jgi:hypothetical protein
MAAKRVVVPALLAAALSVHSAHADPQLGAALTTGIAVTDTRANTNPKLAYHLGGRFDMLLVRERAEALALGPYVDVATAGFETIEAGGGAELLVPAWDTSVLVSAGPLARSSRFGVEPGVEASVFWGARSYNYHSLYSLGLGVFLQGRFGFGDGRQGDLILGAQIDLEYFALPFILAYEAIRR